MICATGQSIFVSCIYLSSVNVFKKFAENVTNTTHSKRVYSTRGASYRENTASTVELTTQTPQTPQIASVENYNNDAKIDGDTA
jgi:hypothetical protein